MFSNWVYYIISSSDWIWLRREMISRMQIPYIKWKCHNSQIVAFIKKMYQPHNTIFYKLNIADELTSLYLQSIHIQDIKSASI